MTNFPATAIVGATGAVGATFLKLFIERGIEPKHLHMVASSRSAGRTLHHAGNEYLVEGIADFDFRQVDIAFFSAGSQVSRQWAPVAAEAGTLVIDNTNAFRMENDCPLVVPQVNPHAVASRPASGIIANPNCSTIPLTRILKPLDELYGLRDVVVSTYQAASGAGLTGIEELLEHSRDVAADRKLTPEGECFKPGLAFNVVPSIDVLRPDRFTLEEQKMRQESRKILGRADLRFTATCVRVPVINGHSEAAYLRFAQPADLDTVLRALSEQPEVKVHDLEDAAPYPTPQNLTAESDLVHIGRVRIDPDDPHALWVWVVADNLRVGAALNAVQIAELLTKEGAL